MLDTEREENNNEYKILHAAEEEFMLHGYDGAKTTSIAKRAGVTHAMLHYYFRTKENLFNKVYEDKIGLMAQSVINTFSNNSGDIIKSLKAGIEAHFDFIAANPNLPRFLVNELISKPERLKVIEPKIHGFMGLVILQLQKQLDEAYENGIIRKINIIDLVLDIVSLNVFVFIAMPLIRGIATNALYSEADFIAARRKENVEVIMSRIIIKRTQE